MPFVLLQIQMLGYDISWASFNIVEVMSSPKFTYKRVGYLAASQSFHPDTEVRPGCSRRPVSLPGVRWCINMFGVFIAAVAVFAATAESIELICFIDLISCIQIFCQCTNWFVVEVQAAKLPGCCNGFYGLCLSKKGIKHVLCVSERFVREMVPTSPVLSHRIV